MKFQFCLRTLIVAFLILNVGVFAGFKLHEWKYESAINSLNQATDKAEVERKWFVEARDKYVNLMLKEGASVIWTADPHPRIIRKEDGGKGRQLLIPE